MRIVAATLLVLLPAGCMRPVTPDGVPQRERAKLDVALIAILENPARTAALRTWSGSEAVRESLTIATEQEAGDRVVFPLFIRTRDVEATRTGLEALGGRLVLDRGEIVTARAPLDALVPLAARPEVEQITASHRVQQSIR